MTRSPFSGVLPLLLSPALLLLAGCEGGSGATVTGSVTYNGKPVEKGYINFYPTDGKSAPAGGEVSGGKFTVKGVSPGPNRVQVTAAARSAAATMDEGIKEAKQGPPPDAVPADAGGNNEVHEIGSGTATLELKLLPAAHPGGPARK